MSILVPSEDIENAQDQRFRAEVAKIFSTMATLYILQIFKDQKGKKKALENETLPRELIIQIFSNTN